MNSELIQNLLTSSTFRGVTMHRANFIGRRCYILPEPFTVFSGLTSAISASTFKGDVNERRLDSWRQMQVQTFGTVDKADANLDSLAAFGTSVHEAIVEVWQEQSYNFDTERMREYFMESDKKLGIPHSEGVVNQKVFEFHKAVAALMQFFHEEVTDVLAVECMTMLPQYFISTPVDLVCTLKNGKRVALNIKTSSAINDHHLNQASMEYEMWNATYPDFAVEMAGIIRPKDWKIDKTPTYDLKLMKPDECRERAIKVQSKMMACLMDSDSTYANFNKQTRIFTGKIKLGEAPKIVTKTIEEAFIESQAINV